MLSGPTALLKQGHLEPVAQDYGQIKSDYPQGGRFNLSRHPMTVHSQVQVYLHSKVLLIFSGNHMSSSLCQWPLVLWLSTTEPGYIRFAHSFQVFINIGKVPSGAFSSPGWKFPDLSVFPHRRGAAALCVSLSSGQVLTGPYLSCTLIIIILISTQ